MLLFRVFLLLFLSIIFASSPFIAYAAKEESEIVYRVNLGRAEDVALLLKQGASANEKDKDGVPLVSLASLRKDDEGLNVLKVLLDAGADINARDRHARNALFYAAKEGNAEITQYLLDKKVDYYAIDSNGDVARTVAYQKGNKDIVKIMDDFARQQAESLQQEYKENRVLLQRYMQQLDAYNAQNAPYGAQQATSENSPIATQVDPKKQEDIVKRVSDVSFNICAFQYWSFVKGVKKTTPLSPKELLTVIDTHRSKAEELNVGLVNDYNIPQRSLDLIVESAKQRIFYQLNGMRSNIERHEKGVGKVEDMKTRCEAIALEWNAPIPVPPRPVVSPPQPIQPGRR